MFRDKYSGKCEVVGGRLKETWYWQSQISMALIWFLPGFDYTRSCPDGCRIWLNQI